MSVTAKPHSEPNYSDVLAAPEHKVAEILAGELHVQPRPAAPHSAAVTALGEELGPPFKRGKGGPGGWILLFEPELHLASDVIVPDLAGWRWQTMAYVPNTPFIEIHPDWVCEVLSPSTERIDRTAKLRIYAREEVGHVWLCNPLTRTLEIMRREGNFWLTLAVYSGHEKVRAEPFHAIELDLAVLWDRVQI